MINTFYIRYRRQHKNNRIIDKAISRMDREMKTGYRYYIFSFISGEKLVTAFIGSQRTVNLNAGIYSCGEFQDYKIPCRHALYLYKEQRLKREDFVSEIYKLAEYKATYQHKFPFIIIDNLSLDPFYQALKWIRLPGRPTVARKRIKKETRKLRCSNCHKFGHNKRRYSTVRRHASDSESEEVESAFGNETEAETIKVEDKAE